MFPYFSLKSLGTDFLDLKSPPSLFNLVSESANRLNSRLSSFKSIFNEAGIHNANQYHQETTHLQNIIMLQNLHIEHQSRLIEDQHHIIDKLRNGSIFKNCDINTSNYANNAFLNSTLENDDNDKNNENNSIQSDFTKSISKNEYDHSIIDKKINGCSQFNTVQQQIIADPSGVVNCAKNRISSLASSIDTRTISCTINKYPQSNENVRSSNKTRAATFTLDDREKRRNPRKMENASVSSSSRKRWRMHSFGQK